MGDRMDLLSPELTENQKDYLTSAEFITALKFLYLEQIDVMRTELDIIETLDEELRKRKRTKHNRDERFNMYVATLQSLANLEEFSTKQMTKTRSQMASEIIRNT